MSKTRRYIYPRMLGHEVLEYTMTYGILNITLLEVLSTAYMKCLILAL